MVFGAAEMPAESNKAKINLVISASSFRPARLSVQYGL
jgi:hypothetical protein